MNHPNHTVDQKPGLRSVPPNPLDSPLYAALQSALSKGFLSAGVLRDLPPVCFYEQQGQGQATTTSHTQHQTLLTTSLCQLLNIEVLVPQDTLCNELHTTSVTTSMN